MPQPYGYAIFDMPPNSDFSSFDTLNNCLPGNCISLFESRFTQKIKAERAKVLSAFMVRVARLELAASWSQRAIGTFF